MVWGENERAFMLPQGTLQHPALEFSWEAGRQLVCELGGEKNHTGLSLNRCGTEMDEVFFFSFLLVPIIRGSQLQSRQRLCGP